MKKLLLLGLILISQLTLAQTFTPDIVRGRIINKSSKFDTDSTSDKMVFPLETTVQMKVRTPALQLTFTQIEKVGDEWKLTTPIYVGYSYIFTYANGIVRPDSSITVENRFFFGGGFNIGITPNLNNVLTGSVPVGAIIGYSRYGFFGGIDVVNGKPLFGLSINVLNFPVLQSTTRFVID